MHEAFKYTDDDDEDDVNTNVVFAKITLWPVRQALYLVASFTEQNL